MQEGSTDEEEDDWEEAHAEELAAIFKGRDLANMEDAEWAELLAGLSDEQHVRGPCCFILTIQDLELTAKEHVSLITVHQLAAWPSWLCNPPAQSRGVLSIQF